MMHLMSHLKKAPVKKLSGIILDALLPPRCPVCRTRIVEHGHLCGKCWAALEPIADPKCTRCSLPFAHESDGLICGACISKPPNFDHAFTPVLYADKGRSLVLALKHGGLFAAAPAMARMMATPVRTSNHLEYDMLVPVPLHRFRLLARRFNQSQLLASALEQELGIHSQNFGLIRSKATPSQATLDRSKRFKNVRSAFSISQNKTNVFQGKRILLVDDVLTTGATASACAKTLKKAGALSVDVVAFARVGQPVTG